MVAPPSPSSSPRAYSPPPAPEVQITTSQLPAVTGEPGPTIIEAEDPAVLDQGATRRIRPGTKAADMASGPPLVPLNQVGPSTAIILSVTPSGIKRLISTQLDSAFQLQEHIKALHHQHTHSATDTTTTVPLTHETALLIATPPDNVDRSLWLYELTRFLTQHANDLLVALLTKIDPTCSAASCPEMRASEWQYLCAVHDTPKPCCAVDYCIHTLDWAGDILTSVKLFPSRMTLGPPDSPGHQTAVRNITNIMRRVYRIFAHAWFQHREGVFWPVEGSGGIYTLFKTVCDVYGLIQEDNYTIPPEAEGLPSKEDMDHDRQEKAGIKKTGDEEGEEDATTLPITGATTRRHKHTPSVGSAVGTIAEGEEDESESPIKEKGGPLAQISIAAEKKDDVPESAGHGPAVGDALTDENATEKGKEPEDIGDAAEDDGDDTASVITAVHDDTEKEAEHEG
ncbi:MAG: hypothetical protein ALECFALPRED_011056 [Alectoria fallacina]|uniref:Mob1/phocein n=1 Tax=Alectoria fallacina TaxID=1903189 RepID=A0A8H3I6W3_9LECA|nr:MAG: hypothetical protein ALECFALPRED_011056 [Alectoria fallacina]